MMYEIIANWLCEHQSAVLMLSILVSVLVGWAFGLSEGIALCKLNHSQEK